MKNLLVFGGSSGTGYEVIKVLSEQYHNFNEFTGNFFLLSDKLSWITGQIL
ncbi:MAG: hypothetical protein K9H84_04930 [Bacteroidales bacterium]|nr:hypothetical protein [Bacteroidales bacterium]